MNFKKGFLLLFVILSFSLAAAAQGDFYEQERDRLEAEQRQQENNKKFEAATGIIPFDLSYFLPNTKDSWFISITTTGGFAGGTQLIAAVNSDGNYLCSTEQDFTNQLIARDVADPLFQTVNNVDFKKFNSHKVKKIEFCSDCSYTTLTFQKGDKIYNYSRNNFFNADNEIKEIYDKVISSSGCQ